MNQKQDFLDLLANLPEVETVDKRRALLGFIGFSSLGIYLDWEGANVVFSSRLVEELSRRGQPTMVQFLDNLPSAPQVGQERQARATGLATAVKALDQTAWAEEFGVSSAAPLSRKPDLDMLALTAVSTVLVPYFKAKGVTGQPAAAALATRVEQALAPDSTASDLWGDFKQEPESSESAMIRIIKRKLPQDAGLAADVEKLTAAAVKELSERKPGEVDVIQRIRLVQGNVLGAAIGSEVINGIIRVCQEVDTVGPGGKLTGVTIGSLGQ